MADLIERLRAFEGSDELGNGDFSLLTEAATEIEKLRAEVAEWKRVAAAQAELHGEAEDRAERMAEALEDIRSRSSIDLAMRSDQFELTALLGDIHKIADAALSKEEGK